MNINQLLPSNFLKLNNDIVIIDIITFFLYCFYFFIYHLFLIMFDATSMVNDPITKRDAGIEARSLYLSSERKIY